MKPTDAATALPYHRLAQSWSGYRWWKPLLTGLLATTFFLVSTVLVVAILVLVGVSRGEGMALPDRLVQLDLSDPLTFAFTMVSVILMLPSIVLATLIMGPRPVGLLSSVLGRLRWRWLLRCTGAAVVVYGLSFVFSLLVLPVASGEPIPTPDIGGEFLWLLVLMTVLLVPLQATAEEYVFRGYLMQTLGGWMRHPALSILLPVPIFVLGHAYEPLGQTDIAVFAVLAGWLMWRTGGLEAAIGAHVINNMSIFLLGAVGLVDVNATDVEPLGLAVSVLTMGFYALVVVRLAERHGVGRTRLAGTAGKPADLAHSG